VFYRNFVAKIFDVKNAVTLKTTHDFLLTFHSNHRPISHRFRDKRRFQSKIANFSHPVYLTPTLKGLPLELGIGAGVRKKLEWWGYQRSKKF